MPEYLHPGVYIQETSYRGVPIEGVSTSTAGMVGRTAKGPEGVATLVTSFTEYQRTFGVPIPVMPGTPPSNGDYLGHAVRAFFENGGLRAYIIRVLAANATAAVGNVTTGVVPLLAANRILSPSAGPVAIPLASTRGIAVNQSLKLYVRPDASSPFVSYAQLGPISAIDVTHNTVTVPQILATDIGGPSAPATISAAASNVYFTIVGQAPTAPSSMPTPPPIQALHRGAGGNELSVQFRPADRTPVAVMAPGVTAGTVVPVATTTGFYPGAIVEIRAAAASAPDYKTVLSTNATVTPRTVTLDGNVTLAANDSLRVLEIDVLVFEDGALKETFAGLTWNNSPLSGERYFITQINDPSTGSEYIMLNPMATPATASGQPVSVEVDTLNNVYWYGLPADLISGDDGDAPSVGDIVGNDGGPGHRTGIQALIDRSDIALVAVPGVTDVTVQLELLNHCELLKYRFAILDGEPEQPDVTQIQAHRNHYDSLYGGYYTPWLDTMDLSTGYTMLCPPSGYVLGICARVDNNRGVWKAPANEVVQGILDVSLPFGNGEQDILNPAGVNLIRSFEGRGIRVWGARCTTSDEEWKYVNVRRLFIYLEHSIDLGTQWVVFEPNTESLWKRVVQSIDSFLFGVWKAGALMGTKPEEAYFIRCDRTTMTQDDIDNGRLICQIGVAPAYPAEFVIFQIGQFTASSPS